MHVHHIPQWTSFDYNLFAEYGWSRCRLIHAKWQMNNWRKQLKKKKVKWSHTDTKKKKKIEEKQLAKIFGQSFSNISMCSLQFKSLFRSFYQFEPI